MGSKYHALLIMLLVLIQVAEVLLGVVLLLFLIGAIHYLLRSRRPDPKMALWLALMKDFPKDENSGSNSQGNTDAGDSDKNAGLPVQRKIDFSPLYDPRRHYAGGLPRFLGSPAILRTNPKITWRSVDGGHQSAIA
jgi:hypothetical protein